MADEPFKVASPEWAKKEFPKRLKMIAEEKYRKSGNSSYGWQTQLANELKIDKSNVSRWTFSYTHQTLPTILLV